MAALFSILSGVLKPIYVVVIEGVDTVIKN